MYELIGAAISSRRDTRLIQPCVRHEDQNGPCVHAHLPAAEQEEYEWTPRLSPSFARGSLEGMGTNETTCADETTCAASNFRQLLSDPDLHVNLLALAELYSQRVINVCSRQILSRGIRLPHYDCTSVVPPQATVIQRLGVEKKIHLQNLCAGLPERVALA